MGRPKDITGQRFGRLTAIKPTPRRSQSKNVIWKFLCDCGNIHYASVSNVISGSVKSCGCAKKGLTATRTKNLVGKRFGRLVVVELTEKRSHGHTIWRCKCDCGNEVLVDVCALRSGGTGSCKCYQKEGAAARTIVDLTGQRFGRLVVIELTTERRDGRVVWLCKCDCGKETRVVSSNLIGGHTRSCGCLSLETKTAPTHDLTNQRFGCLIVLEPTDERRRGVVWKCLCDCEKIVYVSSHELRNGDTQSCGHLQREMMAAKAGPLSPSWNPNLSDSERARQRTQDPEYCEWRRQVLFRDNYTCRACGKHGGGMKLIAHHIESHEDNRNLRVELSNGITLCTDCHNDYHQRYGRRHSCHKDFNAWLQDLELEKRIERGDFYLEEEGKKRERTC